MSGASRHRFNFIYGELVEGPDDIVGLFAYAIYKQEKIAYIKKFKEKNGNREPQPDELEEFHELSMCRCEQYRTIAQQQLNGFMNEVGKYLKADLDTEYNQLLSQRLDEVKTSFWNGVLQSALGSVLFSMLLGAIVVLILGMRFGISGIIEQATQMLIGQ